MKTALLRHRKQKPPLHFRRIEIKYLLPDREIPRLIHRLSPYTDIDPYLREEGLGRTTYFVTSLYFDSVDQHALFEKAAGILSRRKVRLRTYHDTFSMASPFFLEIKRRHDFIISKDRLSLAQGCMHGRTPMPHLLKHMLSHVEGKEAVAQEVQLLHAWYNLQPTTLVRYRRIPFVGKEDERFRITIDHDLGGCWRPMSLEHPSIRKCLHGRSVLELKFNHTVPRWFHNVIQDFSLERVSNSKYAIVTKNLGPPLEECT